jgi:hypothetical protein
MKAAIASVIVIVCAVPGFLVADPLYDAAARSACSTYADGSHGSSGSPRALGSRGPSVC